MIRCYKVGNKIIFIKELDSYYVMTYVLCPERGMYEEPRFIQDILEEQESAEDVPELIKIFMRMVS